MKKLYAALFLVLPFKMLFAQCPIINGALVNSCLREGFNEFVVFTTTAQVAVSNYVLYYSDSTPPVNSPLGILSGANATTKNGTGIITSAGGCTLTYVTSGATVIPTGAIVVFIPSNFTNNFDISPFCTSGNIYVVLIDITGASPTTWSADGTIDNTPGDDFRYLQVSNGATTCAANIRSYTQGWETNVHGNFVVWNLAGVATYLNAGCDLITVPVKLLSFTAVGTGNNANIAWQTTNEINSKFFELQRSENGSKFSAIATLPAAGHSSETKKYTFTDVDIPSGANYYRLKMVDLDGTVSYSQVVKVISTGNTFILTNAYPKPALSQLSITWNAPSGGKTTANIYDYAGRMIMSRQFATATGMNYTQLAVSQLPKGQYLLKMMKDGETIVTQFSKQ